MEFDIATCLYDEFYAITNNYLIWSQAYDLVG
jgi:hypothetical protein